MKKKIKDDQLLELKQKYLILKNQAQNFMKSGDINNYLKKIIEIQRTIQNKDFSAAW